MQEIHRYFLAHRSSFPLEAYLGCDENSPQSVASELESKLGIKFSENYSYDECEAYTSEVDRHVICVLGPSRNPINEGDSDGCQISIELVDYSIDGDTEDISESFFNMLKSKSFSFDLKLL